jgi:hypothetical protein
MISMGCREEKWGYGDAMPREEATERGLVMNNGRQRTIKTRLSTYDTRGRDELHSHGSLVASTMR